MKQFFKWLKRLFTKKVKQVEQPKTTTWRPKLIKVTAGGNHAWFSTPNGMVRKPFISKQRGIKMTEYKCLECGELQYTQDSKSVDPCIYCGGKIENLGVPEKENKK